MKPELLAPAGNLEKLKWAVIYGADAVYFGAQFGSLRSFAGNLTYDDAARGMDYLHANNRRGYVTLNIYPFTEEYDKVIETAEKMDSLGVDAFIVSDIGVFSELKKLNLNARLHISTQANTTSSQAVRAYGTLGASRVNLARELSLEQIQAIERDIKNQPGEKIETEVFIHGSVCFSYSGRCAISDYLTGCRANRGECKHPCRWKYFLVEETRPGEYMPVFEDERGLYLFNSKELALFEFVPALAQAGVTSFKIEGRMKSIHYIASTVSFYRQVIDGKSFTKEQALKLLGRTPNRGFSTGFMTGSITPEDYSTGQSLSRASSVFVANVLEQKQDGCSVLEIRNKIHATDTLETLSPDGTISQIKMPDMLRTIDGQLVEFANNSQFVLVEDDLEPFSIVRRIIGKDD